MSHLIPNHNQTRWKQNYWLRDLIKYISRLLRNQIRCCLGFCNRFICLFDLVNFVNLLFELYWHLGSISWNWEPTWTSSTATTNTSTETRLKSGFQIHTNTPEKRMLLYSAQNCLVTYSYHWKLQRMHSRGHVLVMRSEFLIFCLLLCILLGLLNPPPFSRRKK